MKDIYLCFLIDTFQCIIQEEKKRIPQSRELQKKYLQKKIDEYVHNFSVHGLTKIFTGNKFEASFWFTILSFGILLALFIIHGRVSKYYRYDIYTEISSKVTNKNTFPAITFCEHEFLVANYFAYCKENVKVDGPDENKHCSHLEIKYPEITTSTNKSKWSNGLFSIAKCLTWDGKKCDNQIFLQSLQRYNHSCFSLNYHGDLHDIYGHLEIEFSIKRRKTDPKVFVIPHDPDVLEIDTTKIVNLDPGKIYDIGIDKSIIKRLPAPYPSSCTKEKSGDMFPGKYSRRSCIESHTYINQYKFCGDSTDYVRQYIPQKIKEIYHKKKEIKEVKKCIREYSRRETVQVDNCPFPCESLELSVLASFHGGNRFKPSDSINNSYSVNVQLEHIDSVRSIEEKELYSSYQMLCEIGGFVGLVIGASLISCIEVITYIVLVTVKKTLK